MVAYNIEFYTPRWYVHFLTWLNLGCVVNGVAGVGTDQGTCPTHYLCSDSGTCLGR